MYFGHHKKHWAHKLPLCLVSPCGALCRLVGPCVAAMSHQGGVTSPLSTELCNLRRKAKRGHTEGKPPRLYTDDELEWFAKREKEILAQQTEEKEARLSARMNEHTTKQTDRAIQASKEHTRHSEEFVSAIGGAGSSNDLQIQGQAMLARARQMKHDE